MRELLNVNNTETIKQGDDSTTIILSAQSDGEPATWKAGDIGTIKITSEGSELPAVPATLITGSNNVKISSADLVKLPAGSYTLELWVSQKDGPSHTIYPSKGGLSLTIDKNADDLSAGTIATVTLDDFKQQVSAEIDEKVKNIHIDPKQVDIDLSGYAKKDDVPRVVYEPSAKMLSINGQTVELPATVDLSAYAKKSEVPTAKLDTAARTITIDGNTITIPQSVDLSGYVKETELSDYAKKSDIPAVPDLAPYATSDMVAATYETKSEASQALGMKADAASVPVIQLDTEKRTLTVNGQSVSIPGSVDLSDYAKTNQVPKVVYDAGTKTLTVDGAKVDIPASVDLSNYYTKDEVDSKLATAAAGGKIDLTGYVKETELSDYAKKTDIPAAPDLTPYAKEAELSDYAKKADLPTMPDLAPYAKISDVAETYESKSDAIAALADKVSTSALASYATKDELSTKADASSVPSVSVDVEKQTITVNGKIITVPASINLSGYVKEGELSDYAKKADVPAAPDLSGYLTSSNAANTYETKTDARRDYVTRLTIGQELTKKTEEINSLSQSVTASLATKADKEELASYETKSEASAALDLKADKSSVPSVTLDTASRKLTVNSASITIPSEGGSSQSSDTSALLSQVGQFANYRMQSPFNVPVISVDYIRSFFGDYTYRTSNSTVELDADALTYSLTPKDGASVSAVSGALPPAVYQISTMGDQQGVTVKMNSSTVSDASALIVIPGLTLVVAGQSLWANLTTSRFVGGSSDWPASWHKLF